MKKLFLFFLLGVLFWKIYFYNKSERFAGCTRWDGNIVDSYTADLINSKDPSKRNLYNMSSSFLDCDGTHIGPLFNDVGCR